MQIASCEEQVSHLHSVRARAESEASEAEAAAQQALETGHEEVMRLRRKYDEVAAEVEGLVRQRELVLLGIQEERAEWECSQRVRLSMALCSTVMMQQMKGMSQTLYVCCHVVDMHE